ncbi:unnamed protein product [Haemonchus placei]|uniref:HTH psq-type domain-containing protein n=1 Tax=Haemonchus placei TaxID=6290 RepID=A0A0N4W6A2_HAEPC|nr:unnamed protein product [Haemonchus placei]
MNKMAEQLGIPRKSVQMMVKNELGLRSYHLLIGQKKQSKAEKKIQETTRIFHGCAELRTFFGPTKKRSPWKWIKPLNHRQLLSSAPKSIRKRRIATRSLFPKSLMVWSVSVHQVRLR